jgi:membrane fusion protein (multidrug efflux system)
MLTMLPNILQNKRNRLIAIAVASLMFIVMLIILLQRKSEFTDNAYLKSDIVVIRPKVSGYIVKAISNDNQFLKAGQLIAKIDDKDYKLKVLQAEENVKIAKAKLDSLVHKIYIQNYETGNTSFSKDAAKATLERANKELHRSKDLIKDQAISQATLDKNNELQNNATNNYLSSSANFEASKHKQEIALLERDEAEGYLKASEAALALAKIDLENTEIRAATDGRLSKKSLQVGQLVSPNMAMAYLVQNNIWIIANFKEVQVGNLQIDQHAIVTIDSFSGKKFKARINSLSPATGAEFSILPPENATGNFTKIVQRVPVKVTFEDGQDLSLLKSGMSCEVKVYTR